METPRPDITKLVELLHDPALYNGVKNDWNLNFCLGCHGTSASSTFCEHCNYPYVMVGDRLIRFALASTGFVLAVGGME